MSIEPPTRGAGMDCGETIRSLEAYLDGEFEAREQVEVAAHLSGCERCRARADEAGRARAILRAKLREAMGPGAPAGTAPDALRERIAAALSGRRRSPWRRVLSPVPVGALAACALGALMVGASHRVEDPLVEDAVRKHARDLPLEVSAAMVAPEAIQGMLGPKLEFNPRPPPFQAQGLRIVGARVARLQDRPAALIRYELPNARASLFIVDDPDRRMGESGRVIQLGPSTVRVINARGYNVAVWRRNEIVYSLVSDLDERDLVRLVETAQAAERPGF
jgi:anti-sigma factor RsiW